MKRLKTAERGEDQTLLGNILYAVETTTLRRHGAERLEKEERKIFRKIMEPRRKDRSEDH